MKLVYSRQALADLDAIAAYYSVHASPAIAESIANRLLDVIGRISQVPEPLRAWHNVRRFARQPWFVTHFVFSTVSAAMPSIYCISGTRHGGLRPAAFSRTGQMV